MKREKSDVEMRGFAGEPSQKSGSYHTGHQFTLAQEESSIDEPFAQRKKHGTTFS